MLPANTHAVAASDPAAAASGLAATPALLLPLVLLISLLARLPADARARAAAVCRAWRAAAADAAAWTEVDLTRARGLTCGIKAPEILAALAPRLAHLRVLRLQTGDNPWLREELPAVLRLVRGGHVPALEELCFAGMVLDCGQLDSEPVLRALLAEAPALTELELDELSCNGAGALALLPLTQLHVSIVSWSASQLEPVATCEAVLTALERHGSLQTLEIREVFDAAASPTLLKRVVDTALARHLYALTLFSVNLAGSSAPQLARLLREGTSLGSMSLAGPGDLEDDGGVVIFADALRANTTLRELEFTMMSFWVDEQAAGPMVCAALHGHPSLEYVSFRDVHVGPAQLMDYSVLDASLAGLVRANTPALKTLVLYLNAYDDLPSPTMSHTVNALAGNTHLRTLELMFLSPDASFVRDSLLPAVQANTTLHRLVVYFADKERLDPDLGAAVDEAMELVAARAAASSTRDE